MQCNNYLKRKMPILAILGLLIGFTSCGSYQYVGVDNDGIYDTSEPHIQYQDAVVEIPNPSNSNYYKNYFRNKSLEAELISADDAIFTDIDSYSSDNFVDNDSLTNDYQGYAGWGQDSNSVTINYIDNGWNNWGWKAMLVGDKMQIM